MRLDARGPGRIWPVDGASLTTDLLRVVYAEGAFPMGDETGEVNFYIPRERAIFDLASGVHVSSSFGKVLRRADFRVSVDEAFEEVMRGCYRPTDNWLTEEIVRVYTEAHREGWGHSCEVWREDRLVGGLYGLAVGKCFCAESMFHRESNMSKVALWAMVEKCRTLGFELFDAQMVTPHTLRMGGIPISQPQFMKKFRPIWRDEIEWH